ncbi:helicase-related protein [Clostridium perfringens]
MSKEQKEFYIPRLSREKSLYGTEFEVKLKNELTQKSIAKECVEWIRKKVTFKSNKTNEYMMGFMTVDESTYMPFNGFTTVDLGCERGNNVYYPVQKTESFENSRYYLNLFDTLWKDKNKFTDVTAEVIARIEEAYKENSPEYLYFFTLYNIFSEFLEDISEDDLPNEATGFKESKVWNTLYNFQQDAALGIINKLEKYNGCILADSVGLGKTFTALAVIKYYENRNKSVLVLCPKKLSENWSTYKGNYINNPIAEDRLRYDILFHTDLSRDKGESNGIDLSRLNWENYDLVVIDESHNFRNGGEISKDGKENRYLKLMNKVLRRGVRTKVLMLSATPVNNKFIDLKNQLALAYEGNTEFINKKLDIDRNIDDIFRQAQRAFNTWSKLPPEERLTDNLLKSLEFDFFEILDSVTIARSRKHIERYYDTNDIGNFPKRLKPISKRPPLTDLESAINYNEIYGQLMSLKLSIYTPSNYIFPSKLSKYEDKSKKKNVGITQKGREEGIRRLMSINLLKRLESSVHSFKLTLNRIEEYIKDTINIIAEYKNGNKELDLVDISNVDFDEDDQNIDLFVVGKKVKIDINDMDYVTWENELKADRDNLELLKLMIADIIPEHDSKLQTLFSLIDNKMRNPINEGNKKIIIFTAFSDTADYLYEHVSEYVKKKYSLDTAEITGSVEGKSTIKGQKMDLNTVLTLFSPISKGKKVLLPGSDKEVDVLIATDCISEGQNLQDCDYLVNYDIHWNPVRIIQRFGRIDRIGSKNSQIQLINFWPDMDLDEYINLKARVETRMKISVLTSTGDDNPISPEEKGDLEYRKLQLKRLQEEVVDLEDMSDGISIMDLGLNEYRMDLLDYIKNGVNFDKVPTGLHTIIKAQEDLPSGVIFVLKNINNRINRDRRNRIHPFYMVYISDDGRVITDYLNPKELLDTLRLLSRGYKEPFFDLCKDFNKETDDGKNMGDISVLLSDAINSVVNVKEESDIDSLFKAGGTSALISTVNGIDDFELISFFVVR